ncbi:hypothetical protein Taro_026710 [Colocasia esculenta]|uniref:Uncharacterized protein n=1 Tax=Colocasia esculenta TaxID=4460 RepID=A0A843V6U6_COLES|nr:hypothetical protein [Colocasia esculenta]
MHTSGRNFGHGMGVQKICQQEVLLQPVPSGAPLGLPRVLDPTTAKGGRGKAPLFEPTLRIVFPPGNAATWSSLGLLGRRRHAPWRWPPASAPAASLLSGRTTSKRGGEPPVRLPLPEASPPKHAAAGSPRGSLRRCRHLPLQPPPPPQLLAGVAPPALLLLPPPLQSPAEIAAAASLFPSQREGQAGERRQKMASPAVAFPWPRGIKIKMKIKKGEKK